MSSWKSAKRLTIGMNAPRKARLPTILRVGAAEREQAFRRLTETQTQSVDGRETGVKARSDGERYVAKRRYPFASWLPGAIAAWSLLTSSPCPAAAASPAVPD